MSLLSVAQSESSFNVVSNLDTAATEFVRKTGSTASNEAFGTLTQSSDSLTGNASYIFGASARVLYAGLGTGQTTNIVQEFVFKKSTKPVGSTANLSAIPNNLTVASTANQVYIDTGGNIGTYFRGVSTGTTLTTTSVDYCDNKWHHVVVYYGNGTNQFRLYVDGVLKDSATTTGNMSTYSVWNIGSDLSQNLITASSYFDGIIDFAAIYSGTNYSTSGMDNFVANHMAEFANKVLSATALTASGLAVQPAITTVRSVSYTASPATASAAFAEAIQSARDSFTLLDTYMSTLTLEQYYEFDEAKSITNLGTGGTTGWIFAGNSRSDITSGIQGHGALRFAGTYDDPIYTIGTQASSTEFTDDDFSFGFWVKKSTNEYANIFTATDIASEHLDVYFDANGYISVNARLQNQDHIITGTTDYADGNWHYVAVRKSGTTMQLWVDNVSKGTITVTHSMAGFTGLAFGDSNTTATELMYVSSFYIATSANVTSTQIANIWTYGQPTVQGGAAMAMPKFSRDNALNAYIDSKSPNFSFRMDEASGVPLNYGSTTLSLTQQGTNFTQNISSPNYKSYNFTNRDTQFNGTWNATAGTFSTNNRQTMLVYAKFASAGLSGIAGTAAFAVGSGTGMFLQQLANGTVRLRSSDGTTTEDATTSVNFADNAYHMFVAVKDGSSLKLYVDGVEQASNASATHTFTDSGQLAIGGVPGQAPTAASRNLTVDEVSVFNTAFSAQDAFEAYQKIALIQDTTATALMVQPGITVGFGPTINPGVGYATALLVDPTQLDTIAPTIAVMTVDAMFQMPNFAAIKNTSNAAAVMTVSAQGENPAVTAGGVVGALHMNATASFPEAKARIPGVWNADPFTTSAEMVQPGLATTRGGLVKPQSLNAKAQLPLPPAYFTITDDIWYQRLVAVDKQSPFAIGNITFFNTSTDIYLGGEYAGWKAENRSYGSYGNVATYNDFATPLPVAYAGYYDGQNRKALNLRNIILTTGYVNGNLGAGAKDFTLEAMIKTTKDTQVLFVGENSNLYNFQRTGIILKNGKLALTESKDSRLGRVLTSDQLAFTGNKNIADGEWHHIIIQTRQSGVDANAARVQFWIDGELDIQRYGNTMYKVNQVGYNSNDVNSYSDFYISAVSINESSMVEQREIALNYLAAFNIVPVEAPAATASATFTPDNKGRGNRGRALMLYFWPTFNAESGYYKPYQRYEGGNIGIGSTTNDQGTYGSDPDTFYQLTTFIKNGANKFYDWDMWPLAVTAPPLGDTFPGDTHPLLKDGVMKDGGYKDPITDNYRYLNLMEDLKDLSQFDMICFRNYPDDSSERDDYGTSAKGVNDSYFGTLNKDLFEVFLKSLRDAVDSGISLLITNPQLAIDMGFIDTYHTVDALDGFGNQIGSDPFVPVKLNDPLNTGAAVLNMNYQTAITTDGGRANAYADYYRNNYHQVVNTLPGLTDDPTYIWKDEVYYKPDGLEYGELDRIWSHVEYNAALQPGDKFLISSMINAYGYYAIPIEAIKAGKVITKFADTYMHGTTERVNPYRNYATSIAVEPGTVVAGKQIGAKVFISFTDNVGNQQSLTPSYLNPGSNVGVESRSVELKSDYWIDYAFSTGSITSEERDYYKALPNNLDRLYPNGGAVANALKYWTLDGQNIVGSRTQFGDSGSDVGVDTSESVKKGKAVAKTRAGMRRRNTVSTSSMPSYTVTSGWLFPIVTVPVPSINTRALWWLSERLEYAGNLPQRPVAFEGDAFMPQPQVSGFKIASVNAQSALASATIVETDLRSGTSSINSAPLPMTATAQLVPLGLNVIPGVATASARIATNFSTITSSGDDIVLYVIHEDPILYIREDAIK
jgi:hypothetical protein